MSQAYYVLSIYPIKIAAEIATAQVLSFLVHVHGSIVRYVASLILTKQQHVIKLTFIAVMLIIVYTSESFIYTYVQYAAWHVDRLGNSRIFIVFFPKATILKYTYSLFSIHYVDNCKYSASRTFNRSF